jgi:hypothetical protein
MSVEFEELAKLRDNPSDEQASRYFYIYCYAVVYYPKLLTPLLWCGGYLPQLQAVTVMPWSVDSSVASTTLEIGTQRVSVDWGS